MAETKHHLFKSWRIKHADVLAKPINTKKYRIKPLDVSKAELSVTKSKLDDEYKKSRFGMFWSNFDPFKYERSNAAVLGNTMNVSNAWLKCFEIIMAYDLINHIEKFENQYFVHFDNAAFPGSFVISTYHLINTLFEKYAGKYVWRASSLLEANDQNSTPLEDKYKLYDTYKDHWLMHEHNNGDVLKEENQIDFCRQLGNQVDLYTSDLGFDVSSDYNNQELIQLPANIGQILTGLLTLKKGGSFITKQYTTFEPSTVAIMYAVSHFFEEFYLCKPYTSRTANSETYLAGKGFKGGVYLKHPYIAAMFDRISNRVPIDVPMFDAKEYPKEYLVTIVKSAKDLSDSQIKKLDLDIARVNKCLVSKYRGPPKDEPTVKAFYESVEDTLEEWFKLNPILPIPANKKLNMRDALGQT